MSDLTPAGVVTALRSIADQLEKKSHEVAALDVAHVKLKAAHKQAYARAFMQAEGAMDIRRYQADDATADLYLELELAEQVLRAGREAVKVLRDRLEVGRSVGSIVKMEWHS